MIKRLLIVLVVILGLIFVPWGFGIAIEWYILPTWPEWAVGFIGLIITYFFGMILYWICTGEQIGLVIVGLCLLLSSCRGLVVGKPRNQDTLRVQCPKNPN